MLKKGSLHAPRFTAPYYTAPLSIDRDPTRLRKPFFSTLLRPAKTAVIDRITTSSDPLPLPAAVRLTSMRVMSHLSIGIDYSTNYPR